MTTFGVGELSALNAIAGAYAERAPVVHVVGTPDRSLQESRALIHHTLADGDYRMFAQMQTDITVAQVCLSDHRTSTAQIDAVLEQCLVHSRPVRIAIPADMVAMCVPAARLQSRVSIPCTVRQPRTEDEAFCRILDRMYACKQPMILVDGESLPFGILDEIEDLASATNWPTFTTIFGKSLVDESLPNFRGIFTPTHKDLMDTCDLILCFGPHYTSTNTYGYLTIPRTDITISFNATAVQIGNDTIRDLPAKYVLSRLIKQLDHSRIKRGPPNIAIDGCEETPSLVSDSEPVTQSGGFWQRMSSFFRPGDIILAETGTSGYGSHEFILPPHTRLFKPVTWLSIGYMLPAALGASLAQQDCIAQSNYYNITNGRTILFIGDGSFQMTVQELSTIIHQKLDVVIFLINNDGYTIERCIHGRNQKYNDVAPWQYLKAPSFFGAQKEGEYAAHTWEVKTWGDLERVRTDKMMLSGKGVKMVEVYMEKLDAPKLLLGFLNRQELVEMKEDKV